MARRILFKESGLTGSVPSGFKFVGYDGGAIFSECLPDGSIFPIGSGTGSSAIQMTGTTTMAFDRPRIYNTRLSALSGEITADLSGCRIGVIQKMYHNDVSSPTFSGANWNLISGSYNNSSLNIIYAEWVTSTEIEYWII